MARIKHESELLNIEVRKQIIEEIEGRENKGRKFNSYKKYQCYKDKTHHYVVDLLLRQFDSDTVEEMRYALSNISIVKKVVDKLARVYSNGVERSISEDEDATKKLKTIEKRLDINTALKKTNRFLKFQRNIDLFIKPCPVPSVDGTTNEWTIKLEALNPYLFDVVEDYYDRTKAIATILSDYQPPATSLAFFDGKRAPLPAYALPNQGTVKGDNKDQVIADSAQDQTLADSKVYIFWTKNYHFTCNSKGDILPDANNPENKNPLGIFNHIQFAIDQDGAFWAEGGDDLIDGAILINALITHVNHVSTLQGYGQFYMTGENLPRSIKVGPTKAIIAEYKKDEQAEPKMGFLNANPQLDSVRGLIEMYIALYLTTNNLSTSGVSTQLSGGNTLPSGVALILDKAESLEDVQDQRQVFIDKEPDIFEVINKTLKTYNTSLVPELKDLILPDNFKENFNVKFNDANPIVSESEKLANLKVRKELGIDSMISILMKDDSTLDESQAEEKLKKLVEQRIKEKILENKLMKQTGPEYDTEDAVDEADINEETDSTDSMDMNETETETPEQTKPSSGTPTVGVPAAGPDQNVQQLALNGAQVTALVDIVEKVAAGTLPRESAVQMIVVAFNVQSTDAEKILGSAGKGFKIEAPAQAAPAPQTGVINESNQNNG